MNESPSYCSLNTWAQGLISPGRLSVFHTVLVVLLHLLGAEGPPTFSSAAACVCVHRGRNFQVCILLLSHCIVLLFYGSQLGWEHCPALVHLGYLAPQLRCLMAELLPQVVCRHPSGEGALQLPPAETQLCFWGFQVGVPGGEMACSHVWSSAHEAAESLGKGAEGTHICNVMD